MIIWAVDIDKNYARLIVQDEKTAILTAFHGNQLNNVWKPLTFEMHPIDVNEKIGDFVQLQGCIGCSEEAKNYILELTSGNIEFLPVFYQDTILYALNVVEVIDCLDEKKSEIEYFPNAGRIRVIKRYELKSELLSGKHIFKIPQRIMGTIYVSDDFKNLIEQNRLSGLTFYKNGRVKILCQQHGQSQLIGIVMEVLQIPMMM